MDSFVEVMKKVAKNEASKIYTNELAVVTSVFPHASESDKDNYQCSVVLKNHKQPDGSDFELRKVPVLTQHIGWANIPNVDDLVVVSFIGGDINAPVIIGRLYNDQDQPPVNNEEEVLLQHSKEKGSSMKMDKDGVLTLNSPENKSVVTVNDEEVTVNLQNGKSQVNVNGDAVEITTGSGKISIKLEGGGITLDATNNPVTIKSMGEIKIGDAATSKVAVGGRALANAVGDNDDIILSTHTHVGNLGAPCPILVPTEKINSIQAKIRNSQVG